MRSPERHLAVVGPTAAGKSAVALEIARLRPDVEIVSVDSMQVYRGMDIGTAKPTESERREVPHHLIDIADPSVEFSVVAFQEAFADTISGIESRGHRAALVGGTGLYLRAIVDGLRPPGRWPEIREELECEADTAALHERLGQLDPVAAARMQPSNRRRVIRALEVTLGSGRPFSSFGPGLESYPRSLFHLAGIDVPRPVLDSRIERRFEQMLARGLVDEVRRLLSSPGLSPTARQALGYREVLRHVEGGEALESCVDDAVRRTKRLARRQQSWFRRDPRVTWLEGHDNAVAVAQRVLGDWEAQCRP